LTYFLRERTKIIRLFYDKGRVPFEQLKRDIEDEVQPWESPAYSSDIDSGEPKFLEEWMQAEQTRELVGMLAVSLLSDTLKLYLDAYAAEMAWREDKRRESNGTQYTMVMGAVAIAPKYGQWREY
jgi:hypothetical protein